ncbi:MAG: hypothetical protein RLZ71_697 [Actinomycetota bacterium]|jgi:hypothetical protein
MFIALAIAGWALTVFVSRVFFKAGKFKLTASIETLVGAGMTWTKQIPAGLVRLIALLELVGAIGVVVAQAAFEVGVLAGIDGFLFAQGWAVAAALGLALTMAVALVMHVARKEIKYTWKINTAVTLAASALAVVLAYLPTSL